MNRFTALIAILMLVGAVATPAIAANAGAATSPAPTVPGKPIRDRYIVVFKDSVSDPALAAHRSVQAAGGKLHFTYTAALRGFAATLPARAVEALRHDPTVAYVEQDQTVSADTTQHNATWGLDRIDQRNRPLNGTYYYTRAGARVFVFVLDTGIRSTHTDFSSPSRVLPGYGYTVYNDGRGTEDCYGHGTHVAATVGGMQWGVAKRAWLVPVRVLGCSGSGSVSGVIAGVDFVTSQRSLRPAVANMSLNAGTSSSLDTAVGRAVDAGVTVVVSAGNGNTDACTSSPARQPKALTVGATSSGDSRASFSNYGKCLDLFAPGASVTSAWYSSNTAMKVLSGTSMATPHVTGVAALLLEANPAATPAAIAGSIVQNATPNRIYSAGSGSPNRLLFSLGTF